jgi:hypothetical protein
MEFQSMKPIDVIRHNIRLTEIRNRLEKATRGPWKAILRKAERLMPIIQFGCPENPDTDYGGFMYGRTGYSPNPDNNAVFIAHCPDDVEFLLDEVDRLKAEVAALRDAGRAGRPPLKG